jgi:hypothetical protein
MVYMPAFPRRHTASGASGHGCARIVHRCGAALASGRGAAPGCRLAVRAAGTPASVRRDCKQALRPRDTMLALHFLMTLSQCCGATPCWRVPTPAAASSVIKCRTTPSPRRHLPYCFGGRTDHLLHIHPIDHSLDLAVQTADRCTQMYRLPCLTKCFLLGND